MDKAFPIANTCSAARSFDDLKHLMVSASRYFSKGEVLELADALYNEVRERRAAAADMQIAGSR